MEKESIRKKRRLIGSNWIALLNARSADCQAGSVLKSDHLQVRQRLVYQSKQIIQTQRCEYYMWSCVDFMSHFSWFFLPVVDRDAQHLVKRIIDWLRYDFRVWFCRLSIETLSWSSTSGSVNTKDNLRASHHGIQCPNRPTRDVNFSFAFLRGRLWKIKVIIKILKFFQVHFKPFAKSSN